MLRTFILLLASALAGCSTIAGNVLHDSRDRFNETAQLTNAEQLLRNLVRLRYAESPYFLEISSVSTSATMAGSLGIFGNTSPSLPGFDPNILINPTVSYSQTPSFVFQPLTGEKFGRQLLRPVELRTIALLRTAGWDLRDILLVLVDSINGVANAPAATQFAPLTVPENAEFRRVVEIIDRLEDSGFIQIGLEANATAPDPRGDIVLSVQIEKSAPPRGRPGANAPPHPGPEEPHLPARRGRDRRWRPDDRRQAALGARGDALPLERHRRARGRSPRWPRTGRARRRRSAGRLVSHARGRVHCAHVGHNAVGGLRQRPPRQPLVPHRPD
jgi:hypothetical protein